MNRKTAVAGVLGLLLLAPACTDLTEVPQSAITPENFYRNEDEVIGGLASVYAQLRSLNDDYYNTSEITTDEMVVPTRGRWWGRTIRVWVTSRTRSISRRRRARR